MSDEVAEYTIRLINQVSDPARDAATAMDRLERQMKSAQAADRASAELAKKVALGTLAVAASAAVAVVGVADLAMQASEAQESLFELAKAQYQFNDSAQEAVDATYAVSQSSALTQDKVFGLSQTVMDAGVSVNIYADTLQALADTSSVAGDKATKSIEKIIKKTEQLGTFKIKDTDLKGSGIKYAEVVAQIAKDTNKSVEQVKVALASGQITAEQGIKAMNEALENKFAEGAQAKTLAFSVQIQKAKENIANLFKDVDAGPFLRALKPILSILDGSTAQGKQLKSILTGAMNSFFKAAGNALPVVERLFLSMGIAVLDTYLAMKPAIAQVKKLLGLDDHKTTDSLKIATGIGKALGIVLGATATITAAGFAAIAITLRGFIKAGQAVSGVWSKMTAGLSKVYSKVKGELSKAVDYVQGLPDEFEAAGKAIIDALANAITAGASKVVGAVKGVMSGAVQAGKDAIGMHSPPARFVEMATASVDALETHFDAGKDRVRSSVNELLTLSDPLSAANDNGTARGRVRPAAALAGGAAGGGSSKVVHVSFGPGSIVVNAAPGQDTKAIAVAVRHEFKSLFEEMRTGTGGG